MPRPRAPRPRGTPPRLLPHERREAASTPPQQEPQKQTSRPPREQREPDKGFVAVGRVRGPFGVKGELKVESLTDNPDRFKRGAKLWLGDQPVTVAGVRAAQGFIYLTLKGHRDRTGVEPYRGRIIQVPEASLPALPEGEYYRFQLVGLEVVDRQGSPLGVVEEVLETGANDVYRVRAPDGKELLLPALDDVIVSVDLEAKRIVADPPAWR